jgi:hypothetical protein
MAYWDRRGTGAFIVIAITGVLAGDPRDGPVAGDGHRDLVPGV